MKQYTLGLYEKAIPEKLNWKDKLSAAKEGGFDFLEISIDETDDKLSRLEWSKEERLRLIELMYEADMPIRTMCLSGHRRYPIGSNDPAVCRRGMEIMEKAIELADDLGIRIIQLAGYDVYYEQSDQNTVERFGENLNKSVDMAASFGVSMGFETMETEFMDTVCKAMNYVDLIQSAYLNVYPDCGNIKNSSVKYGTDLYEDLQSGRGHLVALHLKETIPGKYREISYGTGHVDFAKIIAAAWDLKIRKYVTEFWFTGNPNWKKDLEDANKMMRVRLNEVAKCGI